MQNWGLIIIVVFVVVYLFITIKKQQKSMDENQKKLNDIKVGDKVKTRIGIYGVLVDSYETTDGKIAKLNISQDGIDCIIDVPFSIIMGIDDKKLIKRGENNEIISIDGIPIDEYEKQFDLETGKAKTESDLESQNKE